ncbi:hypothetical protein [Lactobacillus crispatus]
MRKGINTLAFLVKEKFEMNRIPLPVKFIFFLRR